MDSRWSQGLLTLAAVILVVLELTGEIAWSRILVLAPLWVPAAPTVGLRLAAVALLGALTYLVVVGSESSHFPDVLDRIPLIHHLPWEHLT